MRKCNIKRTFLLKDQLDCTINIAEYSQNSVEYKRRNSKKEKMTKGSCKTKCFNKENEARMSDLNTKLNQLKCTTSSTEIREGKVRNAAKI